ncbi:cobalt-zinc-cadmium resistance domain protein [Mycobacterium kansasii]|uniref:Cobalt-zinc-cadmium resistance domain protein n=1 Tax=Mycobacterium kansasii TaxID=1768 RepID=A0A1V3WY82_MYCKA|nr:cobalt-zinc-cadmium resistance domain protein [Mycobacterium kansasii]
MINGLRDPAASFPLAHRFDDRADRRRANRAVALSAAGLALTGLIELAIAMVSGRWRCSATRCTICPMSRRVWWCSSDFGARGSRLASTIPMGWSGPRISPASGWRW